MKYSYADDEYAKDYFKGEISVSGKFIFQKNEYDDWIEIHFVPDKQSALRLPYKKDIGLVTDLFIEEDEENKILANKLLPKKFRDKILSGTLARVGISSTIIITNYRAEVDCDHTYYFVRIARVVRKAELQTDPTPAKYGNCG